MRRQDVQGWVCGRDSANTPAVPLYYPLIAVLTILVTIAPSSWLVTTDRGYWISLVVLAVVAIFGILFTNARVTTRPAFLVVFGGYWLGLVAHHWLHDPHTQLWYLIISTPIAVFTTVVILPQFVRGRPQTFTMGLTLASVTLALVGIWVLWQAGSGNPPVSRFVGEEVMGLYAIRTVSVFSNPNPYGFFMMIGSLAALYTALVRGGALWYGTLGLCLLGLVMSEGDAALVGFLIGAIIVLSGRHAVLSYLGIGVGVLVLYGLIRIGHVPEVMETTLMSRVDRWVRSLELLIAEPLWGIGFATVGSEIGIGREFDHSSMFPPLSSVTGTSSGPHNSFIYPFLSAGLITGALYVGAVMYALACGIRARWTAWNAYVVGTASGLYVYMVFESHILGVPNVSSVIFGLFVGLLLLDETGAKRTETAAVSTREALETSRIGQAVSWLARAD